jgi:hypothetical protein
MDIYGTLATGRYAVFWLPEFLTLYWQIVHEEGEEKAAQWAIRELQLSLKPSTALRIYRLFRFASYAWRIYLRFARD